MSNPSLNQLEREAETARAKLARDLDTLTSPRTMSAFKEDVKAEVVGAKDALIGNAQSAVTSTLQAVVDDLKAKAMANPGAALAIGAGIAWQLVRRPPVTTMLVGAGLYSLLRTVPSEHPAQTAAVAQALDTVDAATAKVKEWGSQAGALAHETAEQVKDWGSQASSLAKESTETVSEWGSQARVLAQDARDKIQEWSSQTNALAQDSAADLMATRTAEIASRASTTVTRAMQDDEVRDKFLLSAAALAVAAAVGMAYQRRANASE